MEEILVMILSWARNLDGTHGILATGVACVLFSERIKKVWHWLRGENGGSHRGDRRAPDPHILKIETELSNLKDRFENLLKRNDSEHAKMEERIDRMEEKLAKQIDRMEARLTKSIDEIKQAQKGTKQ